MISTPAADNGKGKWKHSVAFDFWLSGISGDAVVRGIDVDPDISISDAVDILLSIDATPVIQYEASKEEWSLLVSIFYGRLDKVLPTSLGPAMSRSRQTTAELAAAYSPYRKNGCNLELLGGIRYTYISTRLTRVATGTSVSMKPDWLDPFIGARLSRGISRNWDWKVRGDIGGFGIGDSSDFTWNLIAGFEYTLSGQSVLDLGWRWLDYDYDSGSGRDRFKLDALYSGPYFGFQYRF